VLQIDVLMGTPEPKLQVLEEGAAKLSANTDMAFTCSGIKVRSTIAEA
jgi:hypothetical protein